MNKHPTTTEHTPAFDVPGSFTIDYLTDSPEGISVTTRRTLGRQAFLGSESPTITRSQATKYREALRNESGFNGISTYNKARDDYENNPTELTKSEMDIQWDNYKERSQASKKVGIRNVEFSDNNLSVDVINVPFHAYRMFAKPESSPELRSLSEAAATAMPIITSDNRLIVQHRAAEKTRMLEPGKSRGNALYSDVPGVSVAGMLDAKQSTSTPGQPSDISNDFITAGIMKEAGEELGLDAEHIKDIRIVGLAKDTIQPHDEFLFLAKTELTAAELYEASRQSRRNKNLGDADFEEKFIDIDASPEAIGTLLTEVKCPIPGTHAAAIVAAGYSIMLDTNGYDAAVQWRNSIEIGINENVKSMNATVADFYKRFPETVEHIPERFWGKEAPGRNLEAYSPAYTPEEQGLPNFEDELVRTGLLPETRKVADRIALFDIDGVLSDPIEKRVTQPEIFDQLINRLKNGSPIGLNTGRSTEWAIENVVKPLSEQIDDPSLLSLLSVIGEKGNTWATMDTKGKLNYGAAPVVVIPNEVIAEVNALLETEYPNDMKVYDPKQTMLSLEMINGGNIEEFKIKQDLIADQLADILEKSGLSGQFAIDKTTIAIDIQSPHASKALGADRFLEILKSKNIAYNTARFDAYGDSVSDLEMADELERRGLDGDFIYVGKQPLPATSKSYAVHTPSDTYSEGTLSYLQQNRNTH